MSDRNEDLQERAYHVQYTNHDPEQVIALIEQDLPKFLELFVTRSREYGDDNKFVLGSRGQFADMWRKFGKLKTGIWEGKESQLTSEGVDEILLDLIGHCFLTLQCRRSEGADSQPVRGESEPEEGSEIIEAARQDARATLTKMVGITNPDTRDRGYEWWSRNQKLNEVRKRHLTIPRYILSLLTDDQLTSALRSHDETPTEREWDRIVSGKSDGRINYDLAEDEA